MTQDPNKPISGAYITLPYILSTFNIYTKFKTIATPTLEKLIVANIKDGPSEPFLYKP